MPGVFRPYTLADVLGTLVSGQSSGLDSSATPMGDFAESDDTVPMTDDWSSTVQADPGWDEGVWGSFTWG
jgi:hypothetical protein